MKYFLKILLGILVFTSCSDDEVVTPTVLCGTEWNYVSPNVEGYKQDLTLYFIGDSKVKFIYDGYYKGELVDEDVSEGSYFYLSPDLKLSFDYRMCGGGSVFSECHLNATINENTLFLNQDDEIFEFKRVGGTNNEDCK